MSLHFLFKNLISTHPPPMIKSYLQFYLSQNNLLSSQIILPLLQHLNLIPPLIFPFQIQLLVPLSLTLILLNHILFLIISILKQLHLILSQLHQKIQICPSFLLGDLIVLENPLHICMTITFKQSLAAPLKYHLYLPLIIHFTNTCPTHIFLHHTKLLHSHFPSCMNQKPTKKL